MSAKVTRCKTERRRHGYHGSKTYAAWRDMKKRCLLPTNKSYPWYGGRGITVCDRWRDKFLDFLSDMGECPEGLSLDRIDNTKGYEPGNCRWATALEQARNRRDNVRIQVGAETLCASEWAARSGLSKTSILARLRAGVSDAELLAPRRRAR